MASALVYYGGARQARCAVALFGACLSAATPAAGYAILHDFAGGEDGAEPLASLTWDGAETFYGTTFRGGGENGTVFKMATDGSDYTILHVFAGYPDGALLRGEVILDGFGNLYGTTSGAGTSFAGTVFKMQTDGTGYAILHTFDGQPSDGANPLAALIYDAAGNLVGTTRGGGSSNMGAVFEWP